MVQDTERLRRQMRNFVRTFDRLIEQTANDGSEAAAKASTRIGHGAEDVRIGLQDLQDQVALRGRRAGRHLKRQLGRHLWPTVGIALAVAAAVAFIATRERRG
ncbi:DUF883 family protein [Pseudoxanthomonas sacheonensis]|uniref:DUF883 family protein n=1 Tax=Pseudoxanthomonas sacheonensis TaxID=443615 RepID=UPI0013CF9AF1|nr:DUF883 family protein [Pseudoxanthomonas sacheonensis]KAF1710745.1 hypothetical protein CSC73_03975 [Pseudoxanthomonas sacheonensis]